MSMIGNYLRLPEQDLDAILDAPESLSSAIYPDEESDEWLSRRLDIDKSWHIIHFLLTDDPWEGSYPLAGAVLGGEPVSEEDVGYGPARYLSKEEVRNVQRALGTITSEKLIERWNQERIDQSDIYPEGWSNSAEDREYISSNYEDLRNFFSEAAENQQAIIIWLS